MKRKVNMTDKTKKAIKDSLKDKDTSDIIENMELLRVINRIMIKFSPQVSKIIDEIIEVIRDAFYEKCAEEHDEFLRNVGIK